MRNAGDGTPSGSTGRRQRASSATARPAGNGGASLFTPAYRVRHATGEQSTPDYGTNRGDQHRWSELDRPSDRQAPSYRQTDYDSGPGSSPWADEGGGYSWMTDDRADGSAWPSYSGESARFSSAIRGFPPVPDEPLPVYPPGPFAAWNRSASDRDGASGSVDRFGIPSRNRPLTREDSARMAATITPDEFDTNHSMPAIKDPILTKDDKARAGTDPRRAPAAHSRPGASSPSQAAASGGGSQAAASGGGSRAATSGGGSRVAASNRGRRASPSKRGAKRQSVRLAIGVAVVIIVAVAAILVISSLGKPGAKSAANTPRPRTTGQSTPGAPAGQWKYIGSRRTDPVPLAVKELFPGAFATRGVYYHVTITKESSNCGAALIGSVLQAAVRRARCSQVLRASYVSHVEQAMATIGVFNLATATAASTAARHAGPAEFVAELPTKRGVTSKIGQGSGIEETVVKGHYLVLIWAEYVNLSAPKTRAQRAHLAAFMATIIQATANNGLSYRMVDGKPSPPA